MTQTADTNGASENSNVPAVTETSGTSGIETFAAAPSETAEPTTRPFTSRLLDYSAHAAMIVGLVGFAWTVSNHVIAHPPATPSQAPMKVAAAAPTSPKPDEFADLRRSNQQMSEEIRHLRAGLDTLRASVHDDKTSAQVRVLQAGLENVQNGIATTRGETAQLTGKLDKVAHEPATKLQQLSERVAKLEKGSVDLTATASIPAGDAARMTEGVPVPPAKPLNTKPNVAKAVAVKSASAEPASVRPVNTKVASAEPMKMPAEAAAESKPQVVPGFVVRDVYEGVALIEGRRGTMEVVPGVGIPGAGIVKSIDRKGNGWTVTTTKGLLAYAAPANAYRRANRPSHDYYPPYREDF